MIRSHEIHPTLAVVRWGARILSVPILLFWGWFLLAHLIGDVGEPSRPLVAGDYVILTSLVASLAGLALAWKWELTGATLTLAALTVCAYFNWRVLIFPGTLILVAAVMHLASWWMGEKWRSKQSA
jgi:hypothetical protein